MKTKFIEANNGPCNWGKFMVAEFTAEEWAARSAVDGNGLLAHRGWHPEMHKLVLDLQTGEGSIFRIGGYAKSDLNDKHQIWVCPLFEPFLTWLYTQDVSDIDKLPSHVELDAPFAFAGYRRTRKEDTAP